MILESVRRITSIQVVAVTARAATGSMCSSTGDISSDLYGLWRGGGVTIPLLLVASPQSSADTANVELAIGAFFRCLVLAVSLMLWSGCSLQPLQQQYLGDLGHFEYRASEPRAAGIVVGVPHAFSEPAAVEYGTAFSTRSGAGIVTAYGFGS